MLHIVNAGGLGDVEMDGLIQQYFSWPTLPFSVLLVTVCAYWLFVIVGAMDVDLFDFDLDVDVDGHESFLDWGLVGLKWFNLGTVPLMVWLSAFALPAWLISTILDKNLTDPTTQETVFAVLRTAGISLISAKLLTQPLRGKLKHIEPNRVEDMIGQTCVITTSEATPEFGQARYEADGAPLMLNVRTAEGAITKGQIAQIVDYSDEQHIYYVRPQSD